MLPWAPRVSVIVGSIPRCLYLRKVSSLTMVITVSRCICARSSFISTPVTDVISSGASEERSAQAFETGRRRSFREIRLRDRALSETAIAANFF